jgi:hypothetical protein
VDEAFNYKFYFRKNNSDEVSNLLVKKNKKRQMGYQTNAPLTGYRKKNKF